MEPIHRTALSLHARHNGNPGKFLKLQKSLLRLGNHVDEAVTPPDRLSAMSMYRARLDRTLSLSTTRLRIVPDTSELCDRYAYDVLKATEAYREKQRKESHRETARMTYDETVALRAELRAEHLKPKQLPRAILDYEQSRLGTEQHDIANINKTDLDDIRAEVRREAIEYILLRRLNDHSDRAVTTAEAFVSELDEIHPPIPQHGHTELDERQWWSNRTQH